MSDKAKLSKYASGEILKRWDDERKLAEALGFKAKTTQAPAMMIEYHNRGRILYGVDSNGQFFSRHGLIKRVLLGWIFGVKVRKLSLHRLAKENTHETSHDSKHTLQPGS